MITPGRLEDDLRWCLQSPPLIRPDGSPTWPSDEWFRELETGHPSTLPLPRHHHHFRLGQHFERLLLAWLDTAATLDLQESNLQVHEARRTVGEFDLLLLNGHVHQHWEAAVKFYLGRGDVHRMSAWFGPNTSDRFDLKYRRLQDHQLRLAAHPAARALLEEMGLRIEEVVCFMKGRLFHPWDDFHDDRLAFPDEVNPNHEKGWWASIDEFTSRASADHRYILLHKINWLSPVSADHELPSMTLEETLSLLNRGKIEQATHLAVADKAGNEISRGFVVTDEWLRRTEAEPTP